MRHCSLLLAATLALAGLSAGCEDWSDSKVPDLDASTQDMTSTQPTTSATNHQRSHNADTTGSSDSSGNQ